MKVDLLNIFGKDPGPQPLPRSRVVALHICWTALVPAFCYMFLADAPLFFLMAIPFAAVSIALPRSARLNARTKIYSFMGPLVVASLIDLVYKVNMEAYFMTITVISPLLIFYAISTSLLDQRPVSVITGMAAGMGAMLLQGMTTREPELIRMASFLPHPLLAKRFPLFILGILAQSYSILQIPKYTRLLQQNRDSENVDLQIKRALITICSTLILFVAAAGVSMGSASLYKQLDGITHPLFLNYINRFRNKIVFRNKITTDTTLEHKNKEEGKRPALYLTGSMPPGYLRGRVYQEYSRGTWKSAPVTELLPSKVGTGGLSARSWISEAALTLPTKNMDVIPADQFLPEVVYIPGNVQGIEAIGDRFKTNEDGIITIDGWDRSSGYRYMNTEVDQLAACPGPEAPGEAYLAVPEEMQKVVYAYGKGLTKDCTTDAERVYAIRDFLQANFKYSLKPSTLEKDEDPVINFLRVRRAGHCELFASSTVLMLRSLGIPSRYVTGFVCFERLPGNTYVARFRDSHAWVEAWLPERGWILVETTPASGIPGADDTPSLRDRISGAIAAWAKQVVAGLKRGYLAREIISGWFAFWHYMRIIFLSAYAVVSWPLFIASFLLLRKRLSNRQHSMSRHPNNKEFTQLRQRLLKFLRKWKIVYSNDMSLRDISQAAQRQALPHAGEFVQLLEEYEALRYSRAASADDIALFTEKFSAWTRGHNKA